MKKERSQEVPLDITPEQAAYITKIQKRHRPPVKGALLRILLDKAFTAFLRAIAQHEGLGHHILGHVFERMTYADHALGDNTPLGVTLERLMKQVMEEDLWHLFLGVPPGHSPDRMWFSQNPLTRYIELVAYAEVKLSTHHTLSEQLRQETESVQETFRRITAKRSHCHLPREIFNHELGIPENPRRIVILPREHSETQAHSMVEASGWTTQYSSFYYEDIVDMGRALLGRNFGQYNLRDGRMHVSLIETALEYALEQLDIPARKILGACDRSWQTRSEENQDCLARNVAASMLAGKIIPLTSFYQSHDIEIEILRNALDLIGQTEIQEKSTELDLTATEYSNMTGYAKNVWRKILIGAKRAREKFKHRTSIECDPLLIIRGRT